MPNFLGDSFSLKRMGRLEILNSEIASFSSWKCLLLFEDWAGCGSMEWIGQPLTLNPEQELS